MNILQVQDALKNASDMQLSGELQNPTGLAPSYLVLSEMKRRQQMRQGAMASPAPQSSMAEEAASQAQPEYYPEEQPQEEEAGIEAFREGGVVRMAEGGLSAVPLEVLESEYRRRNPVPPEPSRSIELPRWLRGGRREEPPPGTQRWTEPPQFPPGTVLPFGTPRNAIPAQTATREDLEAEISRRRAGSIGASMEAETAPLRNFNPPQAPAVAPTEGQASNELYGPPAPPPSAGAASPRTGASEPRGGSMPSGAAQPSGQTTDPTIQALYDRLRATGQSREDYRKDAVNTGLMQAGLAMMASKDPNALANLGQGGLRGLESYTQEMRQGRLGERQGIQDEITIRRAQTEEAYRRGIITNQERQLRLSELRLGEAAGDRSERRRERSEDRQRELDIRAEGNLRSTLPDITRRIAAINEQLTSIPQRRNPTQEAEYQELIRARGQLEGYAGQIRQRLMTSAGIEANVPAPTQGAPGLPPGARSTPLFPG